MTLRGRRPSAAALVVTIGVASALHIGKLPAAIPVLREVMGTSLLEAGFLLALVQFAGMVGGVFVGLLADRWGPRRVMTIGLLLLAAGSASGAMASDMSALLVSRALEGIGFLLAVLPAPALIRRQMADAGLLSRALGWWGAYMPLGTALALLLVTPLVEAVGWRAVWIGLSAVSVASALALLAGTSADDSNMPPAAAHRLSRTLRAGGPWLVALGFLCYSGQWLAVIGFLPTLAAQAGLSVGVVGLLSALVALVNMVGNVGAGRLLAHGLPAHRVLYAGFAAMGLTAWLAFGLPLSEGLRYLAVLAFSGVGGLIPGTLFVLAVRVAPGPDTVSTTVGWMQQLSSTGQCLGPPLVAWVATQAGDWQHTWVVTGIVSIAGLWIARIIGVRFR